MLQSLHENNTNQQSKTMVPAFCSDTTASFGRFVANFARLGIANLNSLPTGQSSVFAGTYGLSNAFIDRFFFRASVPPKWYHYLFFWKK